MSQLVKTKRQANFKGFKGLVEQKNVVFNSFVCKLGLCWHAWAKKGPIYTQTRQINNYISITFTKLYLPNNILEFERKINFKKLKTCDLT
jgi:hypothetical protein